MAAADDVVDGVDDVGVGRHFHHFVDGGDDARRQEGIDGQADLLGDALFLGVDADVRVLVRSPFTKILSSVCATVGGAACIVVRPLRRSVMVASGLA